MSDRRVVKTYVPAEQKDRWRAHAEQLNMSQSEFVRTMVQAGRRGFEGVESDSTDADPGGRELEAVILEALAERPHDFESLLGEVTEELETELDETLKGLQDRGQVRYSGRAGGYVIDE